MVLCVGPDALLRYVLRRHGGRQAETREQRIEGGARLTALATAGRLQCRLCEAAPGLARVETSETAARPCQCDHRPRFEFYRRCPEPVQFSGLLVGPH